MKTSDAKESGTVALLVARNQKEPYLVEALSDDDEIALLEQAVKDGEQKLLEIVGHYRMKVNREEEEFGDYVEELLSHPFLKPDVQQHGIQWLKSKNRIEEFREREADATRVIAEYAFRMFSENPERTDFLLAGMSAQVRIRVFWVSQEEDASSRQSA